MNRIFCNGCDIELYTGAPPRAALTGECALVGERANGMGGGGMPDGQFHLCEDCGSFAFEALRERREDLAVKR